MTDNDFELKNRVRLMTDYDRSVLSDEQVDTAVERAKRHIRVRKAIQQDDYDWYSDQSREEALFWYACLFSKVISGELDSQDFQAGAIDASNLMAKADGQVTTWYRNAESALAAVDGETRTAHRAVTRDNRVYEEDDSSDASL